MDPDSWPLQAGNNQAMACGLTVITIDHSGLGGMIEDGREGFLMPIRRPGAIHDHLQQLASDAGLLQTMRHSAPGWSWEHS